MNLPALYLCPVAGDYEAMCMEECDEVEIESCSRRGVRCESVVRIATTPPPKRRKVYMTNMFIESARKVSGNPRWPLRDADDSPIGMTVI